MGTIPFGGPGPLERFNREHVEEIISSDPKIAAALVDATRKLREGFYEQDYVDAILQKGYQYRDYDIYDSYGFILIHGGLCLGDILVTEIQVGAVPVKDKQTEEMNRRLKGIEKSGPFTATFRGGTSDNDGLLSWTEPIRMERLSDHEFFTIQPSTAPLEVGSTKVWTSVNHLFGEHYLARWPYHSEWIKVFFNVKKSAEWNPSMMLELVKRKLESELS